MSERQYIQICSLIVYVLKGILIVTKLFLTRIDVLGRSLIAQFTIAWSPFKALELIREDDKDFISILKRVKNCV